MVNNTALVVGLIALLAGGLVGYVGLPPKEVVKEVVKEVKVPGTEVSAQASGLAIWQFPGKRALDPMLFGTPASPLNTELLPLAARDVNTPGTAYTTTKKPTLFSNNIKVVSGTIKMSVQDLAALDNPKSLDRAEMEASFKGPKGEDFKVILKKLIPVGPDHQFFGGVGTDVLMHGATGIGTPLVPREFSYITLWGIGDLYRNGKLADSGRIIHVMVSERIRDDNFKVGFGVAKPGELEIHLVMPPKKGSPSGPVDSPVPTGVTLPNGKQQPFIHVNFYGNIKVEGDRYLG
jgi:hypothetical protein